MAQFSNWKSCGYNNLNMLLNPRFYINQRGINNYEGTCYTVDMWSLGCNGDKTLTVGDGYVELNTSTIGTWTNFCQRLENPLVAGEYTLSFLVDDYTKINIAYALNTNIQKAISTDPKDNLIVFTFKIADGESFNEVGLQKKEEVGSVKVYAAKLEVGTVSTLALDLLQPVTAKMKQQWLMECKRYLQVEQVYGNSVFLKAHQWQTVGLNVVFAEAKYEKMRIVPTISVESPQTGRFITTNNQSSIFNIENFLGVDSGATDDGAKLMFSLKETVASIEQGFVDSIGKVIFSAEL